MDVLVVDDNETDFRVYERVMCRLDSGASRFLSNVRRLRGDAGAGARP